MEFTNNFTVAAPLDTVWSFMLDAREVAPCVPGAQITETIDETHYRGTIKIKLGAVQMNYRGELEMQANESERVINLTARGTETRGSGGASGTVTTRLSEGPEGTEVWIHSNVDVTGRVAQFGRGLMQDVANRLIREFARCLEEKLQARQSPPAPAETPPEPAPPPEAPAANPGRTSQAEQAAPPAASPPAAQAPAPRPPMTELPLSGILLDIARSRLAALLRQLADLIEPKE